MLVMNVMLNKDKLTTVSSDVSIKKALEVIDEHNFLSVPVIKNDKFYGSISKDRIYAFYYEKCLNKECRLSDFTVETVMRTDIPTILPLEQVETAIHYLASMNIAFVAVVDESGVFKGILTHHAVFEQFSEVFGLKGEKLGVIAFDIPGQISKLSKIIAENRGDIISFLVIDPKSVADVREIVMRIRTDNIEHIRKKVKEAGFIIQ